MKQTDGMTPAQATQADLSDQLNERLAQLGQEHCLFTRNGEWFALTIQAAREVLIEETPAPVPHAPQLLAGVINLRGEVLPLVYFDRLMGLESRPMLPEDQILVVQHGNVQMGLIVDRVREVRPIPPQDIRPATEAERRPHVRGIWHSGAGPVFVLDPDSLTHTAVNSMRQGFESFRADPTVTQFPS
jgi:purine-binding chemotaxis protein CheW